MKLTVLMAGLVLLSSSLLTKSLAQAHEEVYIHLQPRVQVTHKAVALKDIATVVGDDSNAAWTQQAVIKLEAGQRLTQQQLELGLLKQFPQLQGRLVWGGAAVITVEGSQQKSSPQKQNLDEGIDQARLWLEQQTERQSGRKLEYKLLGRYKPLSLPAGKVTQLAVVEQARFIGKRVEMPLYIYVDQQLLARRQLVFVQQAQAIEPDAQPSVALTKPASALAVLAVASSASPIRKNQQVKVLIQQGPIQIESEGTAQADAEVGQTVMVKRLDGQETFMAQALQAGIVIVKE